MVGTNSKLFTPVQIGPILLKNRVVMAPLTRSRSEQPGDIPGSLMLKYYTQRASDGGLTIGEAAPVSISSRGWWGAPGLYSDEQVEGWRKIVDSVQAMGGRIFAQLWHTGRSSNVEMTGGATPVSASVNPEYWEDSTRVIFGPGGWIRPSPHRALELGEIAGIVQDYRTAASRAKVAGFDGVELNAGNGYLPDQFLQDGSNKRTDAYGGPVRNRSRFTLEVVDAMAAVWGADRVGVRIAPCGRGNGMSDSNPAALFSYLTGELNRFGLAYLHVIEPRTEVTVADEAKPPVAAEQLRKIFQGKIIAAGGFGPDTAAEIVEKGDADLVAFGRHFISNPDLPNRLRLGATLNRYDRETFYGGGEKGYVDYPALEDDE